MVENDVVACARVVLEQFPEGCCIYKLHRYLYISNVYKLSWGGIPLFNEPFIAIETGPILWSLYEKCKTYASCNIPIEEFAGYDMEDKYNTAVIKYIVENFSILPPMSLCEMVHSRDSAWESTYRKCEYDTTGKLRYAAIYNSDIRNDFAMMNLKLHLNKYHKLFKTMD